MTIKLITGTITAFDTTGELLALKKKGLFYQWYWTRHGWRKMETKFGKRLEQSSLFKMVQTTGSGKTLLAAILLWLSKDKIKTAANMQLSFIDKSIDSFEEFLALEGYEVLLDDVRHIIENWRSPGAKLATEFSNSSRKKRNELLITSQRLMNYVPPDIREIADEVYVPYIRCFDATKKAPDWRPTNQKYLPLEIWSLRFSGDFEYLGYSKYNLTGETGQQILKSFDTMKISKGLK